MSNILETIVEERKSAIQKLGFNFGIEIPKNRTRKVTPFLAEKGVILEVKRASPSKGEIAINLDAVKTAIQYEKNGCKAISVLTESKYFKGSLTDLINVCKATEKTAILRKDFLIDEQEIEIAYKCGADAVLLIARILDDKKLLSMAKKCVSLGISFLLELRIDDDLRKLAIISKEISNNHFVCGVNSRDLENFSIDLLKPVSLYKKIQQIAGNDVRIIFESGIRTAQAASFVGSLGFSGLLLGEAAAKNPLEAKTIVEAFTNSSENSNASVWKKIANLLEIKQKPLVKICGITNENDATKAAELGADFLGFIFSNLSKRSASKELVQNLKKIKSEKNIFFVGVITDTTSELAKQAFDLVKSGIIDIIQVHGTNATQEFLKLPNYQEIPHYFAINLASEDDLNLIHKLKDLGEPRILVDSKSENQIGGTGKQIPLQLIEKNDINHNIWLAGGINAQNVRKTLENNKIELLDISSGIEKEIGKKDFTKMELLFSEIEK